MILIKFLQLLSVRIQKLTSFAGANLPDPTDSMVKRLAQLDYIRPLRLAHACEVMNRILRLLLSNPNYRATRNPALYLAALEEGH